MKLKTKKSKKKSAITRRNAIAAGFRSNFEKELAESLPCPYEYESEIIRWRYAQDKRYTPDLILPKKDGTKMYIEAKGRFYAQDRTKMKYVTNQHPDKDIRMVFMDGGMTLNKNSKTTYMKWCERQGIKAHDCKRSSPELPDEWLEELEEEV